MLCSDPLDYPSDGWLTELTILAKPSSLALPLDYPKRRSAWQQRFAIASLNPYRPMTGRAITKSGMLR
jgi:hypothetical protein